mmetsp:Transcript_12041/g.40927  ORF Transcript_12041/g.40927 Transcript_12041/m.40927 type:complete len:101 (+) Transcript_12041:2149-2451(+)
MTRRGSSPWTTRPCGCAPPREGLAQRRTARLTADTPSRLRLVLRALLLQAALAKGADGKVPLDASKPFRSPIHNFYMTDCITRASPTMASCTETFLGKQG